MLISYSVGVSHYQQWLFVMLLVGYCEYAELNI